MTATPASSPAAPIEAVIFDLDGVLADTEPVHLETSRRLVAPNTIPMEQYVNFIGGSADAYGEWIELTYGIAADDFFGRYTPALVEQILTGPSPAMPGADAIVRAVHRRGLRLAVASMSKQEWVSATLAATGLTELIPLVVTGDEVEHGKPHPDIYLHTAALLGVEPSHCLVVEDSVHGVAAASAAGAWVVQIRQASIHVPEVQPGAHAVIDTFADFDLAWLEGTPLPRAS